MAFLRALGPGGGPDFKPGWLSLVCSATFLPMARIPCSLAPEGSWEHDWVSLLENKAQPTWADPLASVCWEGNLSGQDSQSCFCGEGHKWGLGLAAVPLGLHQDLWGDEGLP